jgi:CheY-like chemotaxis protein
LSTIPDTDHSLHNRIEQIQNAGQRAANLTQQLLAFSRKQTIKPVILDLNKFVHTLETIIKRLVGEKVEFSSDLAADLYPIEADPGQLEQVLINLTANAHDAMPLGGKLSIQTRNVFLTSTDIHTQANLLAGHYVCLTVRDTGHGMTDEVQRHLFEPFFTTKTIGKSTGLGLSTAYGIIGQHQGFLEVESEEGMGTAFHIFLPRTNKLLHLESAVLEPVATPTTANSIQQDRETAETVLVVEDDQPILDLMTMILEESGYVVLQATNGRDALKMAEPTEQPIDLLVSDMLMPGMNGYDLYENLVRQRPDLKAVFVSGYTEMTIVSQNNDSSNIAFLGKPFTWQQLLQKVQHMLDA